MSKIDVKVKVQGLLVVFDYRRVSVASSVAAFLLKSFAAVSIKSVIITNSNIRRVN